MIPPDPKAGKPRRDRSRTVGIPGRAPIRDVAILDDMTLLIDTVAVFVRPVGVVRVSGHDRLGYLDSLLSQRIAEARPGDCADFLYLDHKANPLAAGRAVVRAGDVLLVVDPGNAAGFAEALERFKFLTEVTSEALDGWAQALVRGPGEIRVPGMRSEPMTAAPHGPGMVVSDRSGGADLVGPESWVRERADEMAIPQANGDEWRAWRIANGVPAWGTDISDGRRPQELGLLPTHVHLKKGCYPGQETIAKTWNLGRPRRALAVVAFEGPVADGDAIDVDGRQGVITSSAGTDDGCLALALLPVDRDGGLPETVTSGDIGGRVRGRVGEGQVPPGADALRARTA